MLWSKEILEEMRKLVFEMYQSGKGYKDVSKALGLLQTAVRAIISKRRKLGTLMNFPRSGRPTKLPLRLYWPLIQEDQDEQLRNCRAHLTTANQEEHWRGTSVIWCTNMLKNKPFDDPQTFLDYVLWTEESKLELFGRHESHYIWQKANTESQR